MAARTDKTLSNNVAVQYGVRSISELDTSMKHADSSTVYGILALVTAQAGEVIDGRIIKSAAFGEDRKVVGEALANIADNVFGFDSINGKKPEQKHSAQIKRCAIVATYLMHDYAGADLNGRVAEIMNKAGKGTGKLEVAGRFLIEDENDAEHGRMLVINGMKGRALADLDRAAKAWHKTTTATAGNAQNADDTRKKRVSDLAGSASGQAKMADVLTEELAKIAKKGEKLHKDNVQSFANLKAQIAELARDGEDDSDLLGCVSEIEDVIPHIEKHDERIQDALYELYIKLDVMFGQNESIVRRNELRSNAA